MDEIEYGLFQAAQEVAATVERLRSLRPAMVACEHATPTNRATALDRLDGLELFADELHRSLEQLASSWHNVDLDLDLDRAGSDARGPAVLVGASSDAIDHVSVFTPPFETGFATDLIDVARAPFPFDALDAFDLLPRVPTTACQVLRRGDEVRGLWVSAIEDGRCIVPPGGFAPVDATAVASLLAGIEASSGGTHVGIAQAPDGPYDTELAAAGWRPVWVDAVVDVAAASAAVEFATAPAVVVRPATLADAAQLAELEVEFVAALRSLPDPASIEVEPAAQIAANYRDRLREPFVRLFVAEVEGQLVGQIQWRDTEVPMLIGVNVRSGFERRGIAASLVRTAMADAMDRDVDLLETDWRPSNEQAAARWQRWGCSPSIVWWAPEHQPAP